MFRRKSPPTGPLKPEGASPVEPAAPEAVASEPPSRSPFADKGPDMSPTKPPASNATFKPEIPRRVVEIPGAPVRRPLSESLSAPTASVSSGSSLSSGANEMRKLIVGRDISLSGEITACDRLVVQGDVRVTLDRVRALEVAEGGRFTGGRAEVEEAEVAGEYEGGLTVRGRLLVRGTGRVSGTVRYGELEIERGGRLSGSVEALDEVA